MHNKTFLVAIMFTCSIIFFGCEVTPLPEEISVLTIHNSLDLWDITSITLKKITDDECSDITIGPIPVNESNSMEIPQGDYTLQAIDEDNYEYSLLFSANDNTANVSITVNGSTDYAETTLENNEHAQRVLFSRFSISEQDAHLYALMAEDGMFDGVEGLRGLDYYYRATNYYDAANFLSFVTESSQSYRHHQDYGHQYQTFLNRLETSETNYNRATDHLNPFSAIDQMEARNAIAQGGFEADYTQLSTLERSFVDEIFHANDSSNEWATIQDELLNDAMYIAIRSTDSVSFPAGERALDIMAGRATNAGIAISEIEAYAAWSAAIMSGANRATVAFYRNMITDMDQATQAYSMVELHLGGGGAQGQILCIEVISTLASGSDGSLTEDEFNEVWEAFRDDGRI